MLLPLCATRLTKVEEQRSYCTHEICKLNPCMYGQNHLETEKQTLFFHSNEQNGNKECNLPIQLFSPGGTTLFGFTFIRGRNTIIYHNYKKCQGGLSLFNTQILWGVTENKKEKTTTKRKQSTLVHNMLQITEKCKKTRR